MMVTIVALLGVVAACSTGSGYPSKVADVLAKSGDNRVELEKVLTHFAEGTDTLKYAAACYLIGNMSGHSFVEYRWFDTSGQDVSFDVLAYPDYESLLDAIDAIEQERGELDYERSTVHADMETITADYLINSIDLAFKAWRKRPWAAGISFGEFCDYVLPYRGSNEPLNAWRRDFMDEFDTLPTTMADSTDPIEAAMLINRDIRSWFTFDRRYYLHPTDQSLAQMKESRYGRCEDMTNLAIYAMRANGLAVTSDYTPAWANTGNNHAWNAILVPGQGVMPFMGAEADPGHYNLHNRLAKAYRKTFAVQDDNLVFRAGSHEDIPGWLKGKNYMDVTSDYVEVSDVSITLTEDVPETSQHAYLCVFNSGEWRPVHWGEILPDAQVTFTDMGRHIVYLPAYYAEETVAAGPAFILQQNGEVVHLNGDSTARAEVVITATTIRAPAQATDGIRVTELDPEATYELFWWNGGWQSVGEQNPESGVLRFADIPAGALLWLVQKDGRKEERVFTYHNNEITWW